MVNDILRLKSPLFFNYLCSLKSCIAALHVFTEARSWVYNICTNGSENKKIRYKIHEKFDCMRMKLNTC